MTGITHYTSNSCVILLLPNIPSLQVVFCRCTCLIGMVNWNQTAETKHYNMLLIEASVLVWSRQDDEVLSGRPLTRLSEWLIVESFSQWWSLLSTLQAWGFQHSFFGRNTTRLSSIISNYILVVYAEVQLCSHSCHKALCSIVVTFYNPRCLLAILLLLGRYAVKWCLCQWRTSVVAYR